MSRSDRFFSKNMLNNTPCETKHRCAINKNLSDILFKVESNNFYTILLLPHKMYHT